MFLSSEALISGLSATMLVVTGYFVAVKLMASIKRQKTKLLPWQILLELGAGSFYLGTATSFWILVFTGSNIAPLDLAAILCYTASPLAIVAAMVIGFSMVKPSWTKPVATIYALSGIPFLASLWFNWLGVSKNVPDPGLGNLIDIELLGIVRILTAVYIVSMVAIVATGFVYLALHSTGDVRSRSIYYASGFYLFAICGIIDTQFPLGYWMIFVRIVMVGSYFLLYKAMIPNNIKLVSRKIERSEQSEILVSSLLSKKEVDSV